MGTYFNDVNDWLTVGGDLDLARDATGQDFPTSVAELFAHGVTHVLDLRLHRERPSVAPWVEGGLPESNYLHVPIDDHWGLIPDEDWFETIEAWVHKFWMEAVEGERLYVHCHMGINRAPSAAMLALLTVDPTMEPFEAFLQIREARDVAGLVYAEAVGVRHLLNREGVTAEDLVAMGTLPESVRTFSRAIDSYWTPELRARVRIGIAHFRGLEGQTIEVNRLTDAPLNQPSH